MNSWVNLVQGLVVVNGSRPRSRVGRSVSCGRHRLVVEVGSLARVRVPKVGDMAGLPIVGGCRLVAGHGLVRRVSVVGGLLRRWLILSVVVVVIVVVLVDTNGVLDLVDDRSHDGDSKCDCQGGGLYRRMIEKVVWNIAPV